MKKANNLSEVIAQFDKDQPSIDTFETEFLSRKIETFADMLSATFNYTLKNNQPSKEQLDSLAIMCSDFLYDITVM
ncbi:MULTISPECIES: hypothetical protein [unclassified Campylobacter]|uniref:hypothetical protein n=1 Tax=unclassified Campylobacter TaxID=2593542 RepID=UPI003D328C5F